MSPRAQPASNGGTAELPATRRTVLIVDDEDALLRVLALVFEEHGYRVVTARNGRLALEAYARQGADVVITDFMMPEMDGRELLDALRQLRPRLPVVVMSSLESAIVNDACSGHAHFVRKPFDVRELVQCVSHLAPGAGRDHLRVVK